MIGLFAFLTLPVAVPTESEILVVGRRFAAIEVGIGRDSQGKFVCQLSQSSGSANLDAALCKTSAKCVRNVGANAESVKRCVAERKPGLFDKFRRSARAGRKRS